MTPTHLFILISLVVDLAYGVLVYSNNPRRTANQQFLTLSLILAAWMICVWYALNAATPAMAEVGVRWASLIAQLVPTGFYLLRVAIIRPDLSWTGAMRHTAPLLLINAAIGAMCLTKFFLREVHLPVSLEPPIPSVAEPVYGPGFPIFALYYLGALAWLLIRYISDVLRARGIQRIELQYVLLACGTCLLTGISLALIIPAITGNSHTAPMAPLCAVVLNAIMAYGIATQRIMGVALVMRRITAYTLLTAYLSALYFAMLWAAGSLLRFFNVPHNDWAHLLAALVVAFSMAPANGRMQRLANRLFINARTVDVGAMVRQVSQALQSISTIDDMAHHFVDIISRGLGTDRVLILLRQDEAFTEIFPAQEASTLRLDAASPLVRTLGADRRPLVVDIQKRRVLSATAIEAVTQMNSLGIAAAVGVFFKDRLSGIILLGPRLSGRIYGAAEEDALQFSCDELAIAIENARLFTETRNSRIYNDILLDNLGTGVIAMDRQRRVTVINRDAQRLLGKSVHDLVGKPCHILPAPLGDILKDTLETGVRHADEEVRLHLGADDRLHVRVGGSVFHSHTGETLGALIIFHDVTHLKHLQGQIRRSDHLASMGTLSAGMAHEIKNPLVTIKTFTQLLPERYDDPEFRESFLSLMTDEVRRIDTLVNQLLTFARPAKPSLALIHTHTVVDDSLRLVAQQLEQHHVNVVRDFRCAEDSIMGDADLLSQAFVNFFLNAQDAMPGGGTLRISTSLVQNSRTRQRGGQQPGGNALLLRIEDNGIGIGEDDLGHIFDPFFTTKSHGTGLGLAVSHGIIDEQGGVIDVQSHVGTGTSFLISFPLPEKTEIL